MRQDFIEIEKRPLPWSVAGANGPVNGTAAPVTVQKRLRRVLPETEEDASLSLNSNRPVMSAVISERSVNKWGTPQGYQIQVCGRPFIFDPSCSDSYFACLLLEYEC